MPVNNVKASSSINSIVPEELGARDNKTGNDGRRRICKNLAPRKMCNNYLNYLINKNCESVCYLRIPHAGNEFCKFQVLQAENSYNRGPSHQGVANPTGKAFPNGMGRLHAIS